MKKSVLVLLLCGIFHSAFGQTGRDEYQLDATLLKVKNILEKHFAGSHIYGLQEGFTIMIDSSSNRYIFKSDVIKMRSKSQSEKLNSELNSRLRKKI